MWKPGEPVLLPASPCRVRGGSGAAMRSKPPQWHSHGFAPVTVLLEISLQNVFPLWTMHDILEDFQIPWNCVLMFSNIITSKIINNFLWLMLIHNLKYIIIFCVCSYLVKPFPLSYASSSTESTSLFTEWAGKLNINDIHRRSFFSSVDSLSKSMIPSTCETLCFILTCCPRPLTVLFE